MATDYTVGRKPHRQNQGQTNSINYLIFCKCSGNRAYFFLALFCESTATRSKTLPQEPLSQVNGPWSGNFGEQNTEALPWSSYKFKCIEIQSDHGRNNGSSGNEMLDSGPQAMAAEVALRTLVVP